jgi:hypothetical protein
MPGHVSLEVLGCEDGRVPGHGHGGSDVAVGIADGGCDLYVTRGFYVFDQHVVGLTPMIAIFAAPTVVVIGDDLLPHLIWGIGCQDAAGRT